MCRPPKESNLITFFQDLTFLQNKHLGTPDNVVVMGGINIDVKKVTNQSLEKLNTFCENFGLSNLAKGYTYYSKTQSSVDLLLTNKISSFQLTKATETGISQVYFLVSIYMKTQAARRKSKNFLYGDYKHFDEKTFLLELESKNLIRNSIFSNENYEYLFYKFVQCSLKNKILTRH